MDIHRRPTWVSLVTASTSSSFAVMVKAQHLNAEVVGVVFFSHKKGLHRWAVMREPLAARLFVKTQVIYDLLISMIKFLVFIISNQGKDFFFSLSIESS